ncbi:MAG: H+-translocating transhydrogenase subunit alpha, partial [Cryptosporangiaceae bacterium]|nr:H+-translocating transhydrogenase subunit alpha [Cryptosporangiaceae bacterium]
MTALTVGVVKETGQGERRVALVPDGVAKLVQTGMTVLVEAGAGEQAWFADDAYARAGAAVVPFSELFERADVLLSVGRPPREQVRENQIVIGMLAPLIDPRYARDLAARGVTAVSLDGLPRQLSRAQTMDALSSQASVAGYKAALVAASTFERYMPMLITAAGTAKPAEVLVLGAGVAGLQAIGTTDRLGAIVRGYDVRPASRTEVESLGAKFLVLKTAADAAGEGGYARALTPEEQQAQQKELSDHIARHDIVITTAQVPGRRPPLLVTAEAVKAMAPGSVIVDIAASELGGNCELSEPGRTIVTGNGVTIVGASNLPAAMPIAASNAYSRNISALLMHIVHEGHIAIDLDDEIQAGVVVTHRGEVVHAAPA